jgi:hypothetical protein
MDSPNTAAIRVVEDEAGGLRIEDSGGSSGEEKYVV